MATGSHWLIVWGWMGLARMIGLLIVALLLVASCNRDEDGASQTTAPLATGQVATSGTAAEAGDTTGAPASPDTATSVAAASAGPDGMTIVATTTVVSGLPTYEVVHRLIEDDHETVVMVVEPGTYSKVELENLVYDVVERFSPSVAIVVDDRAVADLAILEERTEDEQKQLDAHTFLRIENGVEVTFYGPYADFPGLTVGS